MFSVGANSELEITALVMAKYMGIVVKHPNLIFTQIQKGEGEISCSVERAAGVWKHQFRSLSKLAYH